jgi:hypothetical protein
MAAVVMAALGVAMAHSVARSRRDGKIFDEKAVTLTDQPGRILIAPERITRVS